MTIFSDYERAILKKYINGARIPNKEEDDILTEWASLGLVVFGLNPRENYPTAKLTESGIKHLYR